MNLKLTIIKNKKLRDSKSRERQIQSSQQATLEFERSRQEEKKSNSLIFKLPNLNKSKEGITSSLESSVIGDKKEMSKNKIESRGDT